MIEVRKVLCYSLESMEMTKAQYNRIADIFSELAKISVVSVVLPLFTSFRPIFAIMGLIFAAIFWIMSVFFSR